MIAVIIVTALIALVQVSAARAGTASPLTTTVSGAALFFEEAASFAVSALRGGTQAAAELPSLAHDNQGLRARNLQLEQENARLHELVAAYRQEIAIAPRVAEYPRALEARVIGYPPEGAVQSVTIDKGTRNGVSRDDGVLSAEGVVGRVVEAGPFTSKVALITDFTSTIPAIVQRGRYWGVAKGNETSVRLDYVSQDAPLRVGDRIVTGEARSFHSGALIGTIQQIERSDSNLYQTAVVKPAVDFSRLDRLVVVPK
ncbi:MAG TPA: rod shape-determining protein MreC [Candidatus Baltobacteraceae bacterium]|jgi:rod shape-determining protein MreC|nr:rod shape-determining protein MreC [Candidatus Baltobacteraceae bacterium]